MQQGDGPKHWTFVLFCLAATFIFYLFLLQKDFYPPKNIPSVIEENDDLIEENTQLRLEIDRLQNIISELKKKK